MKTISRTKKKVKFGTSSSLLLKLKAKRPELLAAVESLPLRMVVAKNLSQLRKAAKLSREALASRTRDEVHERTIQRIEEAKEDSNPTLRVLEALAKALDVPATDLTNPTRVVMGEVL